MKESGEIILTNFEWSRIERVKVEKSKSKGDHWLRRSGERREVMGTLKKMKGR